MNIMERSQIPAKYPELAEHLRTQSLNWDGPFELSSGQHSDYYLDAKRTGLDPQGISLSVDALIEQTNGLDFDAIGGLEFGAAPIIGAFVFRSQQLGKGVFGFVVRKERKAHGTKKEIEGPLPDEPSRVVIVDDVVTSGASILRAITAVRKRKHTVIHAFSIVDREEGAAQMLRAEGIEYSPLVTASELGIADHVNSGSGPASPSESVRRYA